MSEIGLLFLGASKLVIALVAGVLYSLGGRDGVSKGVRRFGVSALLISCVVLFSLLNHSFSPWFLCSLPLYVAALSLGYGADKTYRKIIKRGIFGLAVACAGLPIVIVTGVWSLWILQVILAISSCIILGVLNALTASQEELCIGFLSVVMVLFYV